MTKQKLAKQPDPQEAIIGTVVQRQSGFQPTKFKQLLEYNPIEIMEQAGRFFATDPIVQNILLTQVAMACKKLIVKTTKDKKNVIKRVFDQYNQDINVISKLRWMYLASKVYANVPTVEYWTKRKFKFGTQTKMLSVPDFTMIHPPDHRIVQMPFSQDDKICLKVGTADGELYKESDIDGVNAKYLKPIFKEVLSGTNLDKQRNYIEYSDKLFVFDPESVSVFRALGFPWARYSMPPISGTFNALFRKAKYIEADVAVADGIINSILLAKIGSDEKPGQPVEVTALGTKLTEAARTFTLVWDHRLQMEFISPDPSILQNTEKYQLLNDEIREGLGFSFLNSGAKGRRDVDKIMKMFIEVVDSERREILHWLKTRIYDRILKENDIDAEVNPQFNMMSLAVDDTAKTLVGLYLDRGILSEHTALETVDKVYEEEQELIEAEAEDKKARGVVAPTKPMVNQPDVTKPDPNKNDSKIQVASLDKVLKAFEAGQESILRDRFKGDQDG